jgi:ABC-type multidrug transport system fused ATPase/permease subunit
MSARRGLPPALAGLGQLYRLVWTYAEGHRVRYCLGLALQAAAVVCTLGPPLFLGAAVDSAQRSDGRDLAPVLGWLSLILVAALVAWALNAPGRLLERSVALEVHRSLVDDLLHRALHVDMRWHERRHSGDTTHRIQATVRAVTTFTESQAFLLRSVILFVGSVTALTVLNPAVGAFALVGFGALAALTVGRDRGLQRRLDRHHEAIAGLGGALNDVLGNITTVATLGAGDSLRRRVHDLLDEIAGRGREILVPMEAKWWVITTGSATMHGLLLIGAATVDYATTGQVRVGTLVTVSAYAMSMLTAFEILGGHWQTVLMHQAEARGADELRAASLERVEPAELPADWRQVHLRALELRHPPRDGVGADVRGVTAADLVVRRGERIAVVGSSGAGKSSLLRALTGIYHSHRFDVVVDGVERGDVRSLGSCAGLIVQDCEIFAGTVRSNLDLGTDVPEDRLARACSIAELDPLLAVLPDGLETDLVERGVNLSGGEKQRVGLARGLLHTSDASILLLDEPTSSLDPVTEARIYERLLQERPTTTIVSSIHRLHLLHHFDTVVFMRDGAVVDHGSCDEVARRCPPFAALLRAASATEPSDHPSTSPASPAVTVR